MLTYFILALVLVLAYLFIFKNNESDYWKKYNVVYHDKMFGFIWDFFFGARPIFQVMADICKEYPDDPVVVIKGFVDMVMIKSPEDIQHVLAGDFNNFNDRGFNLNDDVDKLADNVLFMNGKKWKLTRQKFTGLFTSAKLRNMYYIMSKSAQDFVVYLKENNKKENAFDTLSTFCAATVSASVFGISGKKSTMDSPFLDMARKAFNPTFVVNLKMVIANVSPKLYSMLKLKLFGEFEEFFIGAIKQVLQARRESNVKTHDFADLCLEVQRNGTMRDPSTGYELEPTDELMAAQAFFFYVAGVEPSSTSMFFTLFELARNPEILKKVQKEIDDAFERNNGEITHDDITNMTYLDRAMDEAMRMHPAVGVIGRKCLQNSVLPGTKVNIRKNALIQVPIYFIHHNPKYYPNPEKFDPDRFTPEAKQERPHYTFLPFGEGNRMCLGMRYARLQVITGLVYILRHFTVKTEDKEVIYSKGPALLRPDKIDFEFIERVL